jgi:hypothetical protein
MNSFTKKCLMVAAVATLGIIGSVMNPRGGGALVGSANAKDVTDVNIVSPLPVAVGVQGTVAATQSGIWNVGINGTPTVNLNNTAIQPLPVYNVDASGRIPYQKVANKSGQCSGLTNCDFSFGAIVNRSPLVSRAPGRR